MPTYSAAFTYLITAIQVNMASSRQAMLRLG